MDRLQRLRYVTERYEHLQGLRLVPLGIPFLLSSLWRAGQLAWVPGTGGHGARIWFLFLLATAVAVSGAVKIYYRRNFGDVRPAALLSTFSASRTTSTPVAAFVFLALFIVAASTPPAPHAVSIPSIVVALGLAYAGAAGGTVRPHYLAVAAAAALLATLGALGVPLHARDVLLDRLLGIGLIVIGLGDHLVLRRTLVPVSHVDAV